MTTRPHKIQLAALILAIAAMTSGVFPRIQSGFEPASLQSRAGFCEEDPSRFAMSDLNEARWRLPLSFETNRGQAEADVRFVGRGDGFGLLLKPNEAVLSLHTRKQSLPGGAADNATPLNDESSSTRLLSMKIEGANSTPRISGEARQEARANYFIGNDPAKWIRGVETYSRVLYSGVYRGVDLVFYGNERQLEYDFTVAPGGDPGEIRLRFEGADDLELNSEGALILHTAAGAVRHDRPVAYQESNGSRLEVPAEFKRLDDGAVGFQVGAYDPTRALVIDPVLVYSTYVGGSADDFGRGIVTDAVGNAYVIGDSFSSDFLRQASTTNSDVFIGKLSSNGLLLTYTFFGGTKNDSATGLTVDASGNIYLCGSTESPNFPVFNSIGLALRGASDAFVIKLTPAADQFFYSSLVGGSGDETGVSIAADIAGSAYITGRTSSQDFPTFGAIQPIYGGGDSDAFVSKLMPDGKSLVYSSFLGGSGTENTIDRSGISVDASGNAYITGDTRSTDFPTRNALRPAKNGSAASSDGFVAKINPTGADFVYSTYIGGSDDDFALAIANDQAGSAYVAGRTRSTSFTGSSSTRPSAATTDAFVAKLNASGSAISYLTFIGGVGDDSANAIVVDSSGSAVIAGSAGDGLPTVKSIQSFFKGGANDAFVANLLPGGAVTFSTYLGGSGDDVALGVSLEREAPGVGLAENPIYVTGFTDSKDFLTVAPLVRDNAGGRDIFIAKIDPNATPNRPVLIQALISGKHLILYGQGFDAGAVLRVNDEPVKTRNDDPDPTQILFAKKAAKRIAAGETVQLQIENPNGKRSNFLFLTKPQ